MQTILSQMSVADLIALREIAVKKQVSFIEIKSIKDKYSDISMAILEEIDQRLDTVHRQIKKPVEQH